MKDRATILMYHSIGENPSYFWSVTPAMFARQMEYLARSGREVISLAELVRRLKEKQPLNNAVVITFDDGYRDNYLAAVPVLERHQFPATVFISPGLIGGANRQSIERVSADELRSLAASPLITIGSHSMTHPKLARLSLTDARKEIEESKTALEALGYSPAFFSYPHGSVNDDTSRLVREAGFSGAVTTREARVRPGDDPLLLPRYSIDQATTFLAFRAILAGQNSFVRRLLSYIG